MKKRSKLFFLIGLMTILQLQTVLADVTEAGESVSENTATENTTTENTESEEAMPVSEQPDPSIEGAWIGSGTDWQYQLPDGTFLSRNWLYDGGHWYYLDGDGWIVTGKRRIGSDYYYFREDGVMATGWIYNDEEDVWHYGEPSGALKHGWHQAGGVWYWFNSKGEMFSGGNRMIDAHKYYFYENGQLAANQYVGLMYYDENGVRDRRYDITINGDRKPDVDEKERITKAMAEIPREWIRKFNESGWELMYYTDKNYYSAPMTDQGIYYIYYRTDTYYKKLKFTKPEQLPMAFGEYVAWATGNDADENQFMADYSRYLMESSLAQGLPSYFDGDSAMLFGNLFANYCDPDIRADMQRISPEFLDMIETILGVDRSGRRPEEADYLEMTEEERMNSGGNGPASDDRIKEEGKGPATKS